VQRPHSGRITVVQRPYSRELLSLCKGGRTSNLRLAAPFAQSQCTAGLIDAFIKVKKPTAVQLYNLNLYKLSISVPYQGTLDKLSRVTQRLRGLFIMVSYKLLKGFKLSYNLLKARVRVRRFYMPYKEFPKAEFMALFTLSASLIALASESFSITTTIGPSMLPTMSEVGDVIFTDRLSLKFMRLETSQESANRARRESQNDEAPQSAYKEAPPSTFVSSILPTFRRGQVLQCTNPYYSLVALDMAKSYSVIKRITGLPGDLVTEPNGRTVSVPDGHIWLEGDNMDVSRDSREYGPLPLNLVQGIVRFRITPRPRFVGSEDDIPMKGKCVVSRPNN